MTAVRTWTLDPGAVDIAGDVTLVVPGSGTGCARSTRVVISLLATSQ